jgi:hypothetical protein
MFTSVLGQNNFGDTESDGLAGPMGLLIIMLLAVATVLLIRNMNSRLRRLPDRFPGPPDPTTGTGTGTRPDGADAATTPHGGPAPDGSGAPPGSGPTSAARPAGNGRPAAGDGASVDGPSVEA